ncbi:hypothetical protein CK203_113613 [Vitis vinifera]|uniref:Uncharacterized protein n=1 Tax=Vitis vinifera TaxID=29760 RepID=A0A438FEE9_VITVI|nr:hypothetical protein CK203_113613 [Vitis vinifera]
MSANKEATSSSSSGGAHAEKSVDKLSVKEFRDRFCIPNVVSVELTDGEAVSIEKLRTMLSALPRSSSMLGSGSLCRRCSRSFFISPRFLRLISIPIWSGC